MSDPTLFALAFIGSVFGGVAAASAVVRVALVLGEVIRALIGAGGAGAPSQPLAAPRAA